MRLSTILIACLCLSGSADAQRWIVSQGLATAPVIGLLDLPDVTDNFSDDACQSTEAVGKPLFGTPSSAGPAIGIVYKRNHPEFGCTLILKRAGGSLEEELPTDESGYEIPAAVVYERQGRWFRIAMAQGSAWIERENDNQFEPYPILLSERMAYLRDDWDGQLRPGAGVQFKPAPLPIEWKEHVATQIGIEVLGLTRVGREDWIRVRFAIDRCGDSTTATLKPVEGWVPAYRPDGKTTAWFYARGC
jgi:hypothetical protein